MFVEPGRHRERQVLSPGRPSAQEEEGAGATSGQGRLISPQGGQEGGGGGQPCDLEPPVQCQGSSFSALHSALQGSCGDAAPPHRAHSEAGGHPCSLRLPRLDPNGQVSMCAPVCARTCTGLRENVSICLCCLGLESAGHLYL